MLLQCDHTPVIGANLAAQSSINSLVRARISDERSRVFLVFVVPSKQLFPCLSHAVVYPRPVGVNARNQQASFSKSRGAREHNWSSIDLAISGVSGSGCFA